MRHIFSGLTVAFATLFIPFLIYGALAFKTFGLFVPSGYMPLEALSASMADGEFLKLWRAPVFSLNVTSGELIAAMYDISVGALVLASGLGAAFAFHRSRRPVCTLPAATGGGVMGSIIGAQTALLGCCGGGTAGILFLAGIGGGSAESVAAFGQPVQALCIALMIIDAVRPRSGRASALRSDSVGHTARAS